MTLQDAYDDFILDKRAQGLAEKSLESYANILHVFLEYIGTSRDIDTLELIHVKQYSIDLRSRALSKATLSTYIRNAKIFLVWIHEEYGLSFDPSRIKVPKSPKKKARIYSSEEIQHIFASIETSIPWITARNRAMVALMLDSGIRQCELCRLKRADIEMGVRRMKVYGKGDKERYVPVGAFALNALSQYFSLCPYDGENVFFNRNGTPLTGNAVRIFTYRLQQTLQCDFTSHGLRHNFATNYIVDSLEEKNTTGVYDLSILMGHESIETTKKYEHFAHELIAIKSNNSHLDKVYNIAST